METENRKPIYPEIEISRYIDPLDEQRLLESVCRVVVKITTNFRKKQDGVWYLIGVERILNRMLSDTEAELESMKRIIADCHSINHLMIVDTELVGLDGLLINPPDPDQSEESDRLLKGIPRYGN